jgi:hypothetical protein
MLRQRLSRRLSLLGQVSQNILLGRRCNCHRSPQTLSFAKPARNPTKNPYAKKLESNLSFDLTLTTRLLLNCWYGLSNMEVVLIIKAILPLTAL